MFSDLWRWWKQRSFHRLQNKPVEEIFSGIYARNEWGGRPGTFYSGDGTHHGSTPLYIEKVRSFIAERRISSILEIGCGDFLIGQQILKGLDVSYVGGDVVPAMIAHHQQQYQNERIRFQQLDAIEDPLPPAELLIIRQVLQHLNNAQIHKILAKIHPFKYCLITEHLPLSRDAKFNLDKITGPHIRMKLNSGVFIDQPPFSVRNVRVFLEYPFHDNIKGKDVPAVLRTYLVENQ